MADYLTLDVEKFQAALKATNNRKLAEKANVAYNTVRYHLDNPHADKIPIGTFMALCAAMEVDHKTFLKVKKTPTKSKA